MDSPASTNWQVGTNAVLQGYEHSKSDALIRDGIRRMKATGADVALIDPQFAPKVIAKPEIEDMVDLISSAAKQENVEVFHRFALMQHWHEIDGMPFEVFLSSDGLHMNDLQLFRQSPHGRGRRCGDAASAERQWPGESTGANSINKSST